MPDRAPCPPCADDAPKALSRPSSKRADGPKALTKQMREMLDLMVLGREGDPSGAPLSSELAAKAAGYRLKYARLLMRSSIFVDALDARRLAFEAGDARRPVRRRARPADGPQVGAGGIEPAQGAL